MTHEVVCKEVGDRIFDVKCTCGWQAACFYGDVQAGEMAAQHLFAQGLHPSVARRDLFSATVGKRG